MGLTSATFVRALPAQEWYSTENGNRLFRNGAILAVALALHLLAALALGRSSPTRGAARSRAAAITTMWLLGAEPAPSNAIAPNPAVQAARPKSRSVAAPRHETLPP